MRSIKRGFRNFYRHPLRNLVVVLLLFICLTFSLSMLAVKLAADSQIEEVKQSVGNYGEISRQLRLPDELLRGAALHGRERAACRSRAP